MIELYEKPESTECMREMNAIGDKGWQDYVSNDIHNMTSHLMTYPIKVCNMKGSGMMFAACHVSVIVGNITSTEQLQWTLS